MFDIERYKKSWDFASYHHRKQKMINSKIPYLNHLCNVVGEIFNFYLNNYSGLNLDILIQGGILHDVLEDTQCSFSLLECEFGKEIALGVLALSKDKTLEKSLQLKDSIKRIKLQRQEFWIIKLCDRIVNLEDPPTLWNNDKIEKYKMDSIFILKELGGSSYYLSNRLAYKISQYNKE